MAKSVGLDIHSRGVRIVEAARRGKGYRVTRFAERRLHSRGGLPDSVELQEALEELFKSFSKHHVVCALEAGETIVREIPVPFKADDQIRKVIKYEAEHHLHDCDADDVIVQYTRIGESPEGANLLVFAARKEEVGRRIDYARSAGVEPLAMDLDALAIFNTASAAGLLEETPTCVLLKIDHRATEMVFVEEGELRAVRSVRMGIDTIAHGLARDMDIDFDEADQRVGELTAAGEDSGDLLVPMEPLGDRKETEKSHAELERDLFSQKRDELVARLKREYVRSAASLRGARPARVLATGAGLAVPGLLEHLSRRLELAVEPLRLSDHFSAKVDEESAGSFDETGAVALGLALKGLGADALRIDFRQEELRVANKFELLKNPLAVTVTLLFIALMATSFYFLYKKETLSRQRHDDIVTKAYQTFLTACENYNQVNQDEDFVDAGQVEAAGERPLALQRFVAKLRSMRRKLRRKVGGGENVPEITSALRIWNDVFAEVRQHHQEIEYIDVLALDIRQDRFLMTCILPTINAAEEGLKPHLQKLDVLSDWKLVPLSFRPVPGSDYQRTRFEFREER